jgi:hypothetical protein
MIIALIAAGAFLVFAACCALYAGLVIKPKTDALVGELIADGTLTPQEARMIWRACRAGIPYMPPPRERGEA